ncbi:CBF/Mak21 family-domain-containing protein [Infundibulicybe gibba]|nr:CBF/Mak21 family-domain-containing protein [Infundibulicybe gibba]
MGRLRKEKGASLSKPKPKKADKDLKKNVLALGGDQEDYELVKDLDESNIPGPSKADPGLSADVSKFFKRLNFANATADDGQPSEVSSPVTESPKKSSKKNKTPKGKQPQNREHTTADKPVAKKTEPDPPRVQLPTKVSLNPKSHFVFAPTAMWHLALSPLSPTPVTVATPAQLSPLTSRASTLHDADIQMFQKASSTNSSASEASFLSKIIQSGTLSDRLSALTLLVQSSPVHNTKALETLKGMAERGKGKGGRDESLKALRCIVDWWVGGGAPDHKLKYFRDQPVLHPSVTDEYLLLWYFEDWLKKYFFSVLQILETLSLDPLPYVRMQSLTLIFTLLRDKPEQEQNLLRLLVNKLGDTDKSLCSKSSYYLLQLLQTHPSMKSVIVREIIALVLRPPTAPAPTTASTSKHIRFGDLEAPKGKSTQPSDKKGAGLNVHARYYATITFNQIVLTPNDRDVALKLINVYFELFKEILGEDKTEEEAEDENGAEKEVKTDKGGRIRDGKRGKSKGKGKGKGKVEVTGAAGFTEVEDAQSKFISAILTGVNRALPFAKIDAGDVGLNKHIDTLFLITHKSTFNISLQALVLIQQISASLIPSTSTSSTSLSKSIVDRYYRTLYASLHDTRLATSSKQAMYLNLLFKSIKADAGQHNGERVKALVRRFVQVLASGSGGATEFVAGGLYLLGEVFSTIPGLRDTIRGSPTTPNMGEETYDPRKRDPQYAHASASLLWELTPLVNHYHPAVALHARQLLACEPITASPDLALNTLSHFLDRFVYKNPKKAKASAVGATDATAGATLEGGRGASAMQPAAAGSGTGVRRVRGEVDEGGLVNEDAFLRTKKGDVPVDQVFFTNISHGRVNGKNQERETERKDRRRDEGEENNGDEDEDDAPTKPHSDEEEAEIWKAMKASMAGANDLDAIDVEVDDDDGDSDDLDLLDDEDDSDKNDMESSEEDDEGDDDDDDDDDALSLVEASDNEDLISLDHDAPDGLIDGREEEWGGIGAGTTGTKRKLDAEGGSAKQNRKKLRSLPTFASYEDYKAMIEDGPEDDI